MKNGKNLSTYGRIKHFIRHIATLKRHTDNIKFESLFLSYNLEMNTRSFISQSRSRREALIVPWFSTLSSICCGQIYLQDFKNSLCTSKEYLWSKFGVSRLFLAQESTTVIYMQLGHKQYTIRAITPLYTDRLITY